VALEIIGMYGAVTGSTQNGMAQIDVPQDGVLRGLDWDVSSNMDADDEILAVELSFIATQQLTTNDVRGRISSIGIRLAVLSATSGHVALVQKWVGPFELMLAGGERLWLNSNSTVGVVADVRLMLHFDGGALVTRRSARR